MNDLQADGAARRIAVLLPNWIGDCVMATPCLRAMRRRFPIPHEIIGVMQPYVADVLRGTSWLDQVVLYDRKSPDPVRRFGGVARTLRRLAVDTFVLTPNSLSSAWLAWRSGARQRIGYARNGRSLLLTQRLAAPRSGGKFTPVSAVDYYLELAYALGCAAEPRRMELATTPEDRAAADAVWRRYGLDRAQRVIVLSTGGAFGAA
ncbi:MAG: lipopolysaccharide heptosyltransferase II, partial [Planctomycetales bacterium]|nr:lipopolysaccharide heptosyltransferase II [Planctomycetales bacterium]